MPSRLHNRVALVLGGLLIAIPTESFAQRHGGRSHGGGWHGGGSHGDQRGYGRGYRGRHGYGGNVAYYGHRGYGGYRGYRGYGGHPGYYGYRGYAAYPGYYGYGGYYGHHHHNDGVWIALGAGLFGLVVGSLLAPRPVYQYTYPSEAPPPPVAPPPGPVTPRCQDGSPVPVGGYCTAPAEPAPPPKAERG